MSSPVASMLASTIRSFDTIIQNNDDICPSNEAICDIYHLSPVPFSSIPNDLVCCLDDKGLITSVHDDYFTLIYRAQPMRIDLIDLPDNKVREICVRYA